MFFGLEARDAAAQFSNNTTVELWTLYSIGVAVTMLRIYARAGAVGLGNLRLDDYLIWTGILRAAN